ncbi:phosphoribosylformylglycinamidine synthase subunit PurS [Longimicrobium sp.]|uniref:phosphoribosylformylglycinamidine synthase subunit PurS n=1 Tax=Longimicrobium sp. TaxID=2029185 RepID=UPI002B6E6B00|nr:phosphoribosylformylglycinamidine synthase subunit PurS [Longimicrobium sp.]HSU15825.1 phosphoribosylformylglycinamidine synthase subunit PurS [Longimicrobium sp.]
MTDFRVEVRVTPRRGILDPQGSAVQGALKSLGFGGVEDAHVGRLIRFTLSADSEADAAGRVDAMCRQLLANPVTEDYDVRVEALAAA